MKVNDLNERQKSHLVWRLDAKTCCGYLTACRVARGEIMQDKTLVEIFMWADKSERSAKIHATKVKNFTKVIEMETKESE